MKTVLKTLLIILLAHVAFQGCSVKNPTDEVIKDDTPDNPDEPGDGDDGPIAGKKMKIPAWQSAQGGTVPQVTAGGYRASASLGVSVSQKTFKTSAGHKVILSVQSKAHK